MADWFEQLDCFGKGVVSVDAWFRLQSWHPHLHVCKGDLYASCKSASCRCASQFKDFPAIICESKDFLVGVLASSKT